MKRSLYCFYICIFICMRTFPYHTISNIFPGLDQTIYDLLNTLYTQQKTSITPKKITGDARLFNDYPELKEKISYISLGSFPTPILRATSLEKYLQIKQLYIKRDGLSGGYGDDRSQLFGGNQIRKLEFLLADALEHDASHIMTFGCYGSNHAVATAVYGKKLGCTVSTMLCYQPITDFVKQNLCLLIQNNADVHQWISPLDRPLGSALFYIQSYETDKKAPYLIPTGGSTTLGVLGFIQAAFELCDQIKSKDLPEPDIMYVPLGSGATFTGLLIGFQLMGIKTQIIPVAIEPEETIGELSNKVIKLFRDTVLFLHELDPSFPLITLDQVAFTSSIEWRYTGSEYGLPTAEGDDATRLFQSIDIPLDPTYTAKAASALIADAQQKKLSKKTVLFWHTFDESSKKIDDSLLNKVSEKIHDLVNL